MKSKLFYVEQAGMFRGRKELIKHLKGGKITRKQAMDAMCFQCMGYFSEGRQDCKTPECPMFNFRPYKDTKSSEEDLRRRRRNE